MNVVDFRWEITLGDALSIALLLCGAAISATVALRRLLLSWYPMVVDYADQPYFFLESERTFSKERAVSIGSHDVLVRLMPRREIRFEQLSFRWVDRRWHTLTLRRIDTPKEIICLVGLRDLRLESGGNPVLDEVGASSADLPTGGQIVSYSREHRWPAGKPIWYILKVVAKEPWTGDLSVCVERGESARRYSRAGFSVIG